ncbi:MAG: Crp/Fnr family transcriptional regulator [Candidatus Methylomirabilales bacterium]
MKRGRPSMDLGALLQGLSAEEIAAIGRVAVERTYRKGRVIFSAGDSPKAIFVVRKGYVKLVSISERAETILCICKPNDIFGEFILVADQRPFHAVAMDHVVLTVIPKNAFLQLLASVPALALNFTRLVLKRLLEVEEELSDLTHAWAKEKLARLLLKLCKQHGHEAGDGIEIALPLTRQTLADLIGVSRVTVTMQLSELARDGIVTFRGRSLVVDTDKASAYLNATV